MIIPQQAAEATVAAIALLQVVQEDDVLAPLLWEVIERPSWWSVLTNLGASVMVRPSFHAAKLGPSPVATSSVAWSVPMELSVNDQLALQTELFVVPSMRPVALCGGIVGALARHPHDHDREFSLVLLSARLAGGR